jgi:hypothetical protein
MNPAREVKTERPSSKSIPWSRCKECSDFDNRNISLSLPFGRRPAIAGCQPSQQTSQQWPGRLSRQFCVSRHFSSKQVRIKHFPPPVKGRLQRPSKSPWILADMLGCWWTCYYFSLLNLCKYLIMNDLEARGVEPMFR